MSSYIIDASPSGGELAGEVWDKIADLLPIADQANLLCTSSYINGSLLAHKNFKKLIHEQLADVIDSIYTGTIAGNDVIIEYDAQGELVSLIDEPKST